MVTRRVESCWVRAVSRAGGALRFGPAPFRAPAIANAATAPTEDSRSNAGRKGEEAHQTLQVV